MRRRLVGALFGGVAFLVGALAQASTTGAPGTPNSAPDPCRTCAMPAPIQLPDNREHVKPRPAPNPTGDPDVQRGIDNYRQPG